jgi:hypothetical protein
MILHGEMVIELTDENTGTVETVRETNMITNAVNHLLGINPMGVFYKTSGQYDDMLAWNDELLPICPNMIGGILLYPSVLSGMRITFSLHLLYCLSHMLQMMSTQRRIRQEVA